MKSLLTYRKQTASFSIVGLMLAIAPLWLMLDAANTSALAQTSDDVSNSSAMSSAADWTQFHRENMQRWNFYETFLNTTNVNGLKKKWQFTGQPVNFYDEDNFGIIASPTVVNGVVYFGSEDLYLYALDASTGAELWKYLTHDSVISSPAVTNGVVYFGSVDFKVYALNAKTGGKLWIYPTKGVVESSPAVANGVVYIGSDDGNLYALDASTGTKLWSYATGGPIDSSPAVANGAVYFGAEDLNVYALDAKTGAKLWTYTTGDFIYSSPAVANGVVYISSLDGNLYALNASTGAKLWNYLPQMHDELIGSPAVANGVVYFGDLNGNVYALKADTGAKLWSFDTGQGIWSSPAVANGVVYVGSSNGYDYALNAETGALLWSRKGDYDSSPFGDSVLSSPTIVDGVVYSTHAYYSTGGAEHGDYISVFSLGADLFLRIFPSTTTVHQGNLLTYAFPVWNLGPANADQEVLNTQIPAGTTFDYIRISGTPGLGTCTHPPYGGTGQIICHEGDGMAPNTTWTIRLTVKVTAPAGSTITEGAATVSDTPDPNLANNMATVSIKVQ